MLLFAEGATLAHVARPIALAQGLDTARFDTVLCRPQNHARFTHGLPFPVRDLACQDGSVFAHRLEQGSPLYDLSILCRYVDADLALIDAEKPDVIVGDFRLSLSVSARLRSIPYISICDAYWSPERPLIPPLPVLGMTRFVPIALTESLFRQISPLIFRFHALPLERLRARFGLPSLGHDLRRCYTDADLRLFANFRALFPEVTPHAGADFIGPVDWSPDHNGDLGFLTGAEPLVYVTMGSSGDPRVIEKIIPILERTGSRIVITTAGKPIALSSKSPTTRIFDYLPGLRVCQQASLVICNGGSPTTNQALSCGVPVLGIARNMDQFLNMQAIAAYGAGLLIRADRASPAQLKDAIDSLLQNPDFAIRARNLAGESKKEEASDILGKHIADLHRNHQGNLQ